MNGGAVDTRLGARLVLDDIFQYRTYSGVLAGLPFDPISSVESALRRVKDIFPGHDAPARVLAPVLQTGHRKEREQGGREYDEPWQILPRCTTLAQFTADRPAQGADEPYSSIVLVWFQEHFGLPTDPQILDQIVALDWERYAHSWNW